MIKNIKMAQHSNTSFIEKEAIRILSSFIEEKRMAKTFFNENDKTPNYDGFFEILSTKHLEKIPKKQFIVQIKGTENLKYISTGVNKGKYKYLLDTKFLYYVKEKVTENPAIYFVIDVTSNRIFWIYLSDAKLMSLNFEGKDNITYYFSEEEICDNIDTFLNELDLIANERNQKFLNKTPEEIAKIQDAVTYINNLFDNDLKFIKDLMFPDLWRFGIAHSRIPQGSFTMTIGNNIVTSSNGSNSFSIYPQERGIADSGIRENNNLLNGINFFNNIDLTGSTTPMIYVNSVISQILKNFFDSPLTINLSPEVIISEILSNVIIELENVFGLTLENTITEIEKAIYIVIKYILLILKQNKLSDNELSLKSKLIDILNKKQKYPYLDIKINPLFLISEYNCKDSFIEFYNYHKNKKITLDNFNAFILEFLTQDFIEYLVSIKRAKELGLKIIKPIKIDKSDFFLKDKEDKYESARLICKTWFSNLEKVYLQIYNEVFRDNKYLNAGLYKYQIIKPVIQYLSWNVVKYQSDSLSIEESTASVNPFDDKNAISGLSGFGLSDFIYNKNTLYNSMKCLLYQGIANALQLECEGVNFNHSNHKLFEI